MVKVRCGGSVEEKFEQTVAVCGMQKQEAKAFEKVRLQKYTIIAWGVDRKHKMTNIRDKAHSNTIQQKVQKLLQKASTILVP